MVRQELYKSHSALDSAASRACSNLLFVHRRHRGHVVLCLARHTCRGRLAGSWERWDRRALRRQVRMRERCCDVDDAEAGTVYQTRRSVDVALDESKENWGDERGRFLNGERVLTANAAIAITPSGMPTPNPALAPVLSPPLFSSGTLASVGGGVLDPVGGLEALLVVTAALGSVMLK